MKSGSTRTWPVNEASGPLLEGYEPFFLMSMCLTPSRDGHDRILLANILQSSRSTLFCVSFPRVFVFQEGMWEATWRPFGPIHSLPQTSEPVTVGKGCLLYSMASYGLESCVLHGS